MFVAQSLLFYTAGLKLYVHLYAQDIMSTAAAKAVCFVVLLPATLIGAEIFYRVVEQPSFTFGHAFFRWTRK